MSSPEKQTKIWKNIDWTSREEKVAFFNHYFKKGDIANNYADEKLKAFKKGLIDFIEDGKIKLADNKERDITMQDVVEEIKK